MCRQRRLPTPHSAPEFSRLKGSPDDKVTPNQGTDHALNQRRLTLNLDPGSNKSLEAISTCQCRRLHQNPENLVIPLLGPPAKGVG